MGIDLEEVPTDDLMDELLARADHGVVTLLNVRCVNEDGTGDQRVRRVWKGNVHTCLGLTEDIKERILSRWRETELLMDDPLGGDSDDDAP